LQQTLKNVNNSTKSSKSVFWHHQLAIQRKFIVEFGHDYSQDSSHYLTAFRNGVKQLKI